MHLWYIKYCEEDEKRFLHHQLSFAILSSIFFWWDLRKFSKDFSSSSSLLTGIFSAWKFKNRKVFGWTWNNLGYLEVNLSRVQLQKLFWPYIIVVLHVARMLQIDLTVCFFGHRMDERVHLDRFSLAHIRFKLFHLLRRRFLQKNYHMSLKMTRKSHVRLKCVQNTCTIEPLTFISSSLSLRNRSYSGLYSLSYSTRASSTAKRNLSTPAPESRTSVGREARVIMVKNTWHSRP